MIDKESYSLSGHLYEWKNAISREDLLRCDSLQFISEIGDSRWEEFIFISNIAFRGEDEETSPPPYKYTMVCRRSGNRMALLSLNRHISDNIFEKLLSNVFHKQLRKVPIAVDSLVKNIVKHPTEYALSFVHARVPAYGSALRSVSYYGDDLSEASLFRDNVKLMNFFTCGLKQTVSGPEIVRLGGDGFLSFHMNNPNRVKEVEDVLRFLSKNEYLSTNILPEN